LVRLLVDVDVLFGLRKLNAKKRKSTERKKNVVGSAKTTDGADGFAESRRVGKERVAFSFYYNRVFNFGNKEISVDWKKNADFVDFS
jgi:hypothetical protein